MPNLKDLDRKFYLPLLVSVLCYYLLGYEVERTDSTYLITTYLIAFGAYFYILYQKPQHSQIQMLVIVAVLFRIVLIASFPALSDDIYRFVWDGRLINANIHPFAELPTYYLSSNHAVDGLNLELFNNLNSPEYFTIYPPLAQFVFWLATAFTDSIYGSVVIIRILILLAEIGTLFIGLRLLHRYLLPQRNILIYALNPLVILELTGNLHFEAFMIFFILLSVYCLQHNAITKSAFFMAAGIASKLLPLMLIPLFLRRLKTKSLVRWILLTSLFTALFFIPLLNSELIHGMSKSIGLYFQKFEFNASVYYLIRKLGYWVVGYNIIGSVGKVLPFIVIIFIAFLSLKRLGKANVFEMMMWVLTGYFLLSTTVHPWYITTIIALSIFTNYIYVIFWSSLIFLTYLGYHETGFNENLFVVSLEYVAVFIILGHEIFTNVKNKNSKIAGLI